MYYYYNKITLYTHDHGQFFDRWIRWTKWLVSIHTKLIKYKTLYNNVWDSRYYNTVNIVIKMYYVMTENSNSNNDDDESTHILIPTHLYYVLPILVISADILAFHRPKNAFRFSLATPSSATINQITHAAWRLSIVWRTPASIHSLQRHKCIHSRARECARATLLYTLNKYTYYYNKYIQTSISTTRS